MSILSLPRIHFKGFTDWNPSTGNNAADVYIEETVEPYLQPGVTYATYLAWLKQLNTQMMQPNGSWNVYGDHSCSFAETEVTGGQMETACVDSIDPLIGCGVSLQGLIYSDGVAPARMVMTDPFTGGEATSQIYYQWLVVGKLEGPQDQWIGFKAGAACRMFSRFPYQTRNLGITFKEGMVGCTWQAAAYSKDIQWYGVERSPLLSALKKTVSTGSNQGILMRFASYATLYYQNTTFQGKPITNGEELVAAYQAGFTGANPARSSMLGTIGVWESGELASASTDRLLVPAAPAQITDSTTMASLGPAIARIDSARNILVVDFITTFPEANTQLVKADFGKLQLKALDAAGNLTPIATLSYPEYNQQAYEASGGISEFALPEDGLASLGAIELVQSQGAQSVPILTESQFVAETDDWAIYIDQGQSVPVTVMVTENGAAPKSAVKLLMTQYDSDGNLLTTPAVQVEPGNIVPVTNGTAAFQVRSLSPGACFLVFYPFVDDPPSSLPQSGIPLPGSFYAAVRMLPFDDELERSTSDSLLSWKFLYTNVLRVFDLVYPVMSQVRNLADRNVVEAMAEQLKFATSLDTFESTLYMPITRDLSGGKRKLLQRWINLLPNNVPPDSE